MSDDTLTRLQEAQKLFSTKSYDACLRALAACPAEDPRIASNIALVEYCKSGSLRGLYATNGGSRSTPRLAYDGQDGALLAKASILLHNGDVKEARKVAELLVPFAPQMATAQQARLAILLRLVGSRTASAQPQKGKQQKPSLKSLLPCLDATGLEKSDPTLAKAVQVSLADAAGLHVWFRELGSPSAAERAIYFNNLAIEAFYDGRPAIAQHHFGRAVAAVGGSDGASAPSAAQVCPNLFSTVHFNNALAALSQGSTAPATAFAPALKSFLRCTATMGGSPSFWLRIVQLCVQQARALGAKSATRLHDAAVSTQVHDLHENGVKPIFAALPTRTQLHHPAWNNLGAHQQLVVAHQYGVQAAHNGLSLLLLSSSSSSITDKRCESIADAGIRFAKEDGGSSSQLHLLTSLLVNTTYLELSRGNFNVAVHYTTAFFAIYKAKPAALAKEFVALMACYNCEALCAMNKASIALKQMQSIDMMGLLTASEGNTEGTADQQVESLFLSLCLAQIMAGHWAKALQIAQQIIPKFKSKYAALLTLYIELAQGNRDRVMEMLETIDFRPPL